MRGVVFDHGLCVEVAMRGSCSRWLWVYVYMYLVCVRSIEVPHNQLHCKPVMFSLHCYFE